MAAGRGGRTRHPHTMLVTAPADQIPALAPLLATNDGSGADPARVGAVLRGMGPILAETAQRVGCDPRLALLVTGADGEALHLGRARRLATSAQRRAVEHRGGGCRFPGCSRPIHWTDAHHIWHWDRGGPTDTWNLISLCRRHHRLVHEGRWQLTHDHDNGTLRLCRPDGTLAATIAWAANRGRHPPPTTTAQAA